MMSSDESVSEKASLVEQGVDSLMAVEVRSWFLKELEIDIPVLKILGGSSITDLLNEAMETVPTSVVNLGALPDSVKPTEKVMERAVESPPARSESESAETSSESNGSESQTSSGTGTLTQTPSTEVVPSPVSSQMGDKAQDHRESAEYLDLVKTETSSPMSYGQARFWFLNDYLEDKKSFDMTVMFKLTGKMDVGRLERAVQVLAQRHEALRTRFFWAGEGDQRVPMQGVLPKSSMRLVHKHLQSEADAREELRRMHDHEWDLSSWEAAKVHLLSVTDTIHYLLVGGHHISWDGYSFTVLFIDLEAAYSGRPLAPLGPESQYPAFAKWQRETYEMGGMKKEIESYHKIIPNPDIPPIPLFPFAKSPTRPVLDHFSQWEAKATLKPELVSKLKQIARKHRSTMFHVYLAALKGLVFRLLPDIDDCFIGIADANRIDKSFMGSLGFFLNLLPVPFARGKPDTTIGDLVRDARDKAYAALGRSIVPWNVILKELMIPRTNTHAPIFQLFVDYRQITQERSTWGGCKLSDEDWLNARNGYDLTLGITDNPTGESLLSLRLQAGLYSESSTDLLMRSYVHVLETFADGLDIEAASLPCWDPKDVERAIELGKGESD